jgi:tetraacyldisaccharide 4'-kinase
MHKIPSALAPVAGISSLVFESVVRVRNRSYASGLLKQHRLSAPVISVGNITVGGAGKTPLVIYLAQKLSQLGFTAAILSRGYGRQSLNDSYILPPEQAVATPALTLGDEPALIRRRVPGAWMGISKDRFAAGREIANQVKRPAFILDDGFQHRRLYRDLDIVIIDQSQPLKTNRIFPAGTLREPILELCRCHMVVINGMFDAKDGVDPAASEVRAIHEKADLFYCTQTIRALVPFSSWLESRAAVNSDIMPQSVYLTAAIGNPERFYRDIQRLGIEVRGARFFSDHYWIKPDDWRMCVAEARAKSADAIVITEKDAVKLSQPPDYPLQVAVQLTEISDTGAFEQMLKHYIEERS